MDIIVSLLPKPVSRSESMFVHLSFEPGRKSYHELSLVFPGVIGFQICKTLVQITRNFAKNHFKVDNE